MASAPRAPANLSTADLASELEVSQKTIRVWIAEGWIEPDVVTLGNHARFTKASVAQIAQRYRRGRLRAA